MLFIVLITLLTLILHMAVTFEVGRARAKYKIAPPAITGHIEFEKRLRVQQNTIEQMVVFLPALWLFTMMIEKPKLGAIIGTVWLIGRILYVFNYYSDPEKRLPGFIIGNICSLILILGALWGVVFRLMT